MQEKRKKPLRSFSYVLSSKIAQEYLLEREDDFAEGSLVTEAS